MTRRALFKPVNLLKIGSLAFMVGLIMSVAVANSANSQSAVLVIAGLLILFSFAAWALSIIIALINFVKRQGQPNRQQSIHPAPIQSTKPTTKSRLPAKKYIVLVGVFLIALAAVIYQPIADKLTISRADPAMISLAQRAGMNRQGELVFLRTQPKLDSDQQILADCGSLGNSFNQNGEILQGCYLPSSKRIFIRQMPGDFADLEVTTAAYEVLHPIYDSLVANGDTRINKLIEDEYNKRADDQNLAGQVSFFAKTEPGAKDEELFSILGTQYTNLSAGLASYYGLYFANIGLNYTLNQQIMALIPDLKSQLDDLNRRINQDDALANQAYANSLSWARAGNQYQLDRNYNIYVQDINLENNLINQYNQLLEKYNTLITEYNGSQPLNQKSTIQQQAQ